MDVIEAAERVGYAERDRARFEGWGAGPALPDNAEELMEYCGMVADDRREMLAARPDPVRDPEWWALTSAMAGEVEQQLGARYRLQGSAAGRQCHQTPRR